MTKPLRHMFFARFLLCLLVVPSLASWLNAQSGLPAHYYCVSSGVNNGFMHPSVAQKVLFIYNQSEIAGMTAPVTGPVSISRIYFRTNNAGTANYTGVNIRMGHSSIANASTSTTFANNFNVGAPVLVYSGNASFVMSGSNSACNVASTWFYINLTTPFVYNFTNNLCVEISYTGQSGAIPSFYALNPGGGANPTGITAGTAGAATGTLNSRPMFGISATPVVLEEKSIELYPKGKPGQPMLEWESQGFSPDAQFLLHFENHAGGNHSIPVESSGSMIPVLPFRGDIISRISVIESDGSHWESNVVNWYSPSIIVITPNPFSESTLILLPKSVERVKVLGIGNSFEQEFTPVNQEVRLGASLPYGAYLVVIEHAGGARDLRKLVRTN